MNFQNIPKPFYNLLLALTLLSSCNGQVKTQPQIKNLSDTKTTQIGQPKIILTQGVSSGNIGCELQDKDGNIWFSSSGEGVFRYDGKSITNFTTKDGLCDNSTSTIIQDKSGNILIATNAGICKYDGKIFSNYFQSDTLKNLRIISLLQDIDGNIWFSAMNKGIYRYDGINLTNILYKYDHPIFAEMREKIISDILQDMNGKIWFSSFNRGGVWRYDGKILTHFLPSADYYLLHEDERSNLYSATKTKYVHLQDYITDDMIHSMTIDKEGKIWFATRRHGICIYDGKSFSSFKENIPFVSYGIISILEDKKGNMWFTTDKNGVYLYDGKKLINYTTADGLANNSVRSIFEDQAGNIWFGTRMFGLSRFDGKSFTNYSE